MSSTRAQTKTARSGDECTNYLASAPPKEKGKESNKDKCAVLQNQKLLTLARTARHVVTAITMTSIGANGVVTVGVAI